MTPLSVTTGEFADTLGLLRSFTRPAIVPVCTSTFHPDGIYRTRFPNLPLISMIACPDGILHPSKIHIHIAKRKIDIGAFKIIHADMLDRGREPGRTINNIINTLIDIFRSVTGIGCIILRCITVITAVTASRLKYK